MPRKSAGLLLFRRATGGLEVFLVHPGGPYFANRDEGVWSVPKGEIEAGERPREVAQREFEEETGRALAACAGDCGWLELGEITQPGGKRVVAWAVEGEWPEGLEVCSNTIPLEWPPRSGRQIEIPEVDRGCFYALAAARRKITPAQEPFLDRLRTALAADDGRSG